MRRTHPASEVCSRMRRQICTEDCRPCAASHHNLFPSGNACWKLQQPQPSAPVRGLLRCTCQSPGLESALGSLPARPEQTAHCSGQALIAHPTKSPHRLMGAPAGCAGLQARDHSGSAHGAERHEQQFAGISDGTMATHKQLRDFTTAYTCTLTASKNSQQQATECAHPCRSAAAATS